MKFILTQILLISLVSLASHASSVCAILESTEGNGKIGLAVFRDAKRISKVWTGEQNYAHSDLKDFIATGECTVTATPCEVAEAHDGYGKIGLAVFRDAKRISKVWTGEQNYAHSDLKDFIATGECTVTASPCEVAEAHDGYGKIGLAVFRDAKRISKVWTGEQNYAHSDLKDLKRLGLCQ